MANPAICPHCGRKIRTKLLPDRGSLELFIEEHIREYHMEEFLEFKRKEEGR
jgi:hypothetical protein